jgi:hypothetical protein
MSLVDRNSIGILTTRNKRRNMKLLMVLTSHDVLGNTGLKTGFWLEFAAPCFVFRDAGVQLTHASPKGGSGWVFGVGYGGQDYAGAQGASGIGGCEPPIPR